MVRKDTLSPAVKTLFGARPRLLAPLASHKSHLWVARVGAATWLAHTHDHHHVLEQTGGLDNALHQADHACIDIVPRGDASNLDNICDPSRPCAPHGSCCRACCAPQPQCLARCGSRRCLRRARGAEELAVSVPPEACAGDWRRRHLVQPVEHGGDVHAGVPPVRALHAAAHPQDDRGGAGSAARLLFPSSSANCHTVQTHTGSPQKHISLPLDVSPVPWSW